MRSSAIGQSLCPRPKTSGTDTEDDDQASTTGKDNRSRSAKVVVEHSSTEQQTTLLSSHVKKKECEDFAKVTLLPAGIESSYSRWTSLSEESHGTSHDRYSVAAARRLNGSLKASRRSALLENV